MNLYLMSYLITAVWIGTTITAATAYYIATDL